MQKKRGTLLMTTESEFAASDYDVNQHDVVHTVFLMTGPEARHLPSIWEHGTTLARLHDAGVDVT
eukprot:3460670-Prorocentrum_lima.AAC.1